MVSSFNIEGALFGVGGVEEVVDFGAPLPILVGETDSGKSTVFEAMWWVLGVGPKKLQKAASACGSVGFVARIDGVRWRITRSTAPGAKEVCFARGSIEEFHPVKGSATSRSAADVFQDLLGVPRLGSGKTRVTMDLLLPWLYAGQGDLGTYYLSQQSSEARIAVCRVLLGANDAGVEELRQRFAEKERAWSKARNKVRKILREREERDLPTVEELQRRDAQWRQQQEQKALEAQEAGKVLSEMHGELAALQKRTAVAQEAQRAARSAADDRERTARELAHAAGRARGRLEAAREAAADPTTCHECSRPLDLAGLAEDDCPVCRRPDPGRLHRGGANEQRIAKAREAVERADAAAGRAGRAAEDARGRAADADRVVIEAAAAARAFAEDVIAPQQRKVTDLEAAVRELAARLEQNADHLREVAELTALREQLPGLETEKAEAEASYAAARQDTDAMVKSGTDRWSGHLLRRLQACAPGITSASISPDDFSVTVNGEGFDGRGVAGHNRARTNISVLLSLRDTAWEVPAMPVPQFLMVDGPFTGLSDSPEDQRTGQALLDGFTDLATRENPSGAEGQAIIACHRVHGTPGPAVREIPSTYTHSLIPGLPPREPRAHDGRTD
ncbi:AAA family ATPase [Streptomyces sp. NPDC002248]